MADDAPENPLPEGQTPAPAPESTGTGSRQPRVVEPWEPQQRAPRRPDFLDRLVKTSDLPTEAPRERQKSKLGEHRAAAIHWEEDPDDPETSDEAEEEEEASGMNRAQVATLAGLGVVVAVLGAMWFAKSLLIGGGSRAPVAAHPLPEAPAATAHLTDLDVAQATEVMAKFLEALTLEDLRGVVREPDRVWPLIQAHDERTPWKPFIVRQLPTKGDIQVNRGLLAGPVEVDDFQKFILALERTPDGFKVDWESFTGQGEMSWDDLMSRQPTEPVTMRVSLQPDDYFNRDFADSSAFACYQLNSHRNTHRVYGYVPRGSALHMELVARTRNSTRILPTLKVRFPEKAGSNDQVEITEIVADGWLVSEATRVKIDPAFAPADAGAAPGKAESSPQEKQP